MNVMIDLVRMELSASTTKAPLPASVLQTSLVLSVKLVRLITGTRYHLKFIRSFLCIVYLQWILCWFVWFFSAIITGFKFRSIARNLTFTPGLLDNRTYEFRSHADLFCADVCIKLHFLCVMDEIKQFMEYKCTYFQCLADWQNCQKISECLCWL